MMMNSSIESVDRIFPGRSGDPAPPSKRIVDVVARPVFAQHPDFLLRLAGSTLARGRGDRVVGKLSSSVNAESVDARVVISAPIV
ncbi:hypothetical protein F1C58_01190 [Glaciihabitans sp. INWT7]|uniref:hypothetical protein n=1 Tax=Glaciihabitans sp. INWT7 TaxID=2596912 RepID=UPI00162A4C40|nr:hypothetical protein [Glaciihabitans sp. INWT7]QNE45673.1 hypothetical protein F1C58_01190 [Glaciihabitans sp. INWT7]